MRFTLQHVLVWLASCLLLVAVNLALGGHATLFQGFFTLFVCGTGALWGIWRYRKKHPATPVTPLNPVVMGIVGAVLMSLLGGFVFGSHLYEVCTRTHQERESRNMGILYFAGVTDNQESKFIRDVLRFRPQEHNWVPTTEHSFVGIVDWMPSFRYPMLDLALDDIKVLAKLKPIEKCHPFFMLDNPLDLQIAQIRKQSFLELKWRTGQFGSTRQTGTDDEIVAAWWREYEPLLRPLRSNADMKQTILDYRAGKNRDFDSDLSPFATMVGLPP